MAQDKGFPPLSRTVEVQIDVVDRANNPPVWDHTVYGPIYIRENLPVGAKVVSVKARCVGNCQHGHRAPHAAPSPARSAVASRRATLPSLPLPISRWYGTYLLHVFSFVLALIKKYGGYRLTIETFIFLPKLVLKAMVCIIYFHYAEDSRLLLLHLNNFQTHFWLLWRWSGNDW